VTSDPERDLGPAQRERWQPQTADVNVWLNNARAWENSQTADSINAFASNVRIYTSSDVAGLSACPLCYGMQEMVNVVSGPPRSCCGYGTGGDRVIARRRKRHIAYTLFPPWFAVNAPDAPFFPSENGRRPCFFCWHDERMTNDKLFASICSSC
jgi:hypothetical protein